MALFYVCSVAGTLIGAVTRVLADSTVRSVSRTVAGVIAQIPTSDPQQEPWLELSQEATQIAFLSVAGDVPKTTTRPSQNIFWSHRKNHFRLLPPTGHNNLRMGRHRNHCKFFLPIRRRSRLKNYIRALADANTQSIAATFTGAILRTISDSYICPDYKP